MSPDVRAERKSENVKEYYGQTDRLPDYGVDGPLCMSACLPKLYSKGVGEGKIWSTGKSKKKNKTFFLGLSVTKLLWPTQK